MVDICSFEVKTSFELSNLCRMVQFVSMIQMLIQCVYHAFKQDLWCSSRPRATNRKTIKSLTKKLVCNAKDENYCMELLCWSIPEDGAWKPSRHTTKPILMLAMFFKPKNLKFVNSGIGLSRVVCSLKWLQKPFDLLQLIVDVSTDIIDCLELFHNETQTYLHFSLMEYCFLKPKNHTPSSQLYFGLSIFDLQPSAPLHMQSHNKRCCQILW